MVKFAAERLPAMLRARGPERDVASQELRDRLVRVALAYLVRQRYPVEAFGADTYETVAEDFAHDALAIVLRNLDAFRGESRFTTWAYRIVINLMADEMRRRTWRHRLLTEDDVGPGAQASGVAVDMVAERHELWALVQQIISRDLTPRQRQALVGRFFESKPLVVLAEELGGDKDTIYKLIHDARNHLKRALQERGVSVAEVLSAFQGGSQ